MSVLDDARTRELWAKVKEGLSGKQNKLTGTPGQVVGFNAAGEAAAQAGWSNLNLLDNWYFADPTNQRGQTEYNGKGYTIDRWYATELTEKVVVQDGGIQISGPGIQILLQKFENPISGGEIFTFSTLTTDGIFASVTADMIGNGNHSHDSAIGTTSWFLDCWEVNGILQPRIYKVSDADTSISLYAAKLELGTRQTLAHQDASDNWILNDPPPDKALELIKCQRYYQTAGAGLMPIVHSDIETIYTFPFYVPMRTLPAVSLLVSEIMIYDTQTSRDLTFSVEEVVTVSGNENGVSVILLKGTWDKTAPTKGAILRQNRNNPVFGLSADL